MTERVERCARAGLLLSVVYLGGTSQQASAQTGFVPSVGATPSQLQATVVFTLDRGLPLAAADSRLSGAALIQGRASRRDGEILMIVGGAAILTGLLVDESLITIAGAAVGGYGLYVYLRATRKKTP